MRSPSRHGLGWSFVFAGLLLSSLCCPAATSAAARSSKSPAVGASRHVTGTASAATSGVCLSQVQLAQLTTRRLARLVIVDPVDEGDVGSLSGEVASGIGGIILLGSDATAALGSELHQLLLLAPPGRVPFVMVDQEGGAVQRLVATIGQIPSARTMGSTMTPAAIEVLATNLGAKLRRLGVTMDLAPVLDLDGAPGPNSIDADGTRSFSVTGSIATADGLAFARGLLRAGVLPVLKHFPGLGGASGNTDLGPAATKPYVGLGTAGVQPFSAAIAAGAPAVMIANATVPGLTSRPASLSRVVITGLLRHKLGFSGLVLTDSLSVPSITAAGYNLPKAAVAALRAGTDEVLFNATPSAVASDNKAIVAGILHAVARHKLSRATLLAAAGVDEAARDAIAACAP
ncbi:MAG TPA: glycoside hydrolase family 3 N-terminal domain-containing protein [Acidimicrobiales bacterium]